MRALLVPISNDQLKITGTVGTKKHRRITSRNATQPNSAAPVDEARGRTHTEHLEQ